MIRLDVQPLPEHFDGGVRPPVLREQVAGAPVEGGEVPPLIDAARLGQSRVPERAVGQGSPFGGLSSGVGAKRQKERLRRDEVLRAHLPGRLEHGLLLGPAQRHVGCGARHLFPGGRDRAQTVERPQEEVPVLGTIRILGELHVDTKAVVVQVGMQGPRCRRRGWALGRSVLGNRPFLILGRRRLPLRRRQFLEVVLPALRRGAELRHLLHERRQAHPRLPARRRGPRLRPVAKDPHPALPARQGESRGGQQGRRRLGLADR